MTWLVVALVAGVAFASGVRFAARRQNDAEVSSAPPLITAGPAVADVLEALKIGIAVSGRDGAGEFRNSAARAMSGTHVGVLIDDAIERHLSRALAGIQSDEVLELHGPPPAVFVVRSVPLAGGGAVAFVDDISERRRVDRVRTDFVANVSHELKTPIGALSVLAETLQDETDIATMHRLASRMMTETERASNTIDDLLELSRIELGGDRDVTTVRVADVVTSAIDRVRELAARSDITITALDPVDGDAPSKDQLLVEGDRRQLVSALGNIVENAVKYSEPGGSVQLRTKSSDEMVEISVIDRGVGIPRHDVDRIFERFYRVDQARSRSTGGTGIGLSIVRHVATQHGGDVAVTSGEGQGSTFTLRLPIAAGDRPAEGKVESGAATDEGVA